MSYFAELTNGIILSIILNMLVGTIENMLSKELSPNDKQQQNFIISFISGLVFIFLAYSIFDINGRYYNKSIKYGFLLSGIILIINIIFINWDLLSDQTRLLFICISLFLIFKRSFKYS